MTKCFLESLEFFWILKLIQFFVVDWVELFSIVYYQNDENFESTSYARNLIAFSSIYAWIQHYHFIIGTIYKLNSNNIIRQFSEENPTTNPNHIQNAIFLNRFHLELYLSDHDHPNKSFPPNLEIHPHILRPYPLTFDTYLNWATRLRCDGVYHQLHRWIRVGGVSG